jgi:acetyl-CoA carboxylase carboxyl transferase subunit beta
VDLKPYPERLAAAANATGLDDAMVVGRAEIDGHRCALATMEFQFLGGSMGSVVGEKFARAVDLALEDSMPLISVASSGGARMQENVLALMQMAKTTCAVDALNEAGIPFVSVLSHPTTGGVMASFAALGDVIIAEPGALMSFAGPRVVQQTTRERLPDDFGLAESNFRFGHIDMVVPRHELRGTLARLLRLFAGGEFVYAVAEEPEEEPAGVLGRVLQRVRRRSHGPASTNGGASS